MKEFLYRIKGKGTFVNYKKYEKSVHGLTSFSEDMIQNGFSPSSLLNNENVILVDEFIALKLQIKPKNQVLELKRVRLADDEPIALEFVYLPEVIIKELLENVGSLSLYDYIEKELELRIDYLIQEIEAICLEEEISHYLKVEPSSPCLLICLQSYLNNGQILNMLNHIIVLIDIKLFS